MRLHGILVLLLGVAACSMLNRNGPDVTCPELGGGSRNACADGIIATCSGGAVHWRVCNDKSACTQSWQVTDRFRCTESEPVPTLAGGSGGSGGSGATGGSAGSGGATGGGGGAAPGGCDQCISGSCASQLTACSGDAACAQLLACIRACGDKACSKSCVNQHPSDNLGFGLRQCVANSCASECPTWP